MFSQITVNSLSTTLRDILEQIKKKRFQLFRNKNVALDSDSLSKSIKLEWNKKPGVAQHLNSRISEFLDCNTSTASNHSYSVDFTLKFLTTVLDNQENNNVTENLDKTLDTNTLSMFCLNLVVCLISFISF